MQNYTNYLIPQKQKKRSPSQGSTLDAKNRIHYVTCYCLFLNFIACCLPFEVVMVFFILYVRLQ